MGRRFSWVVKCRVAAGPRARVAVVETSVTHFRGPRRIFLGELVGAGAGGGRTPGRIGDGLGEHFFPGCVDNCLNSDSSDSYDAYSFHSALHRLRQRSLLQEPGEPELELYAGSLSTTTLADQALAMSTIPGTFRGLLLGICSVLEQLQVHAKDRCVCTRLFVTGADSSGCGLYGRAGLPVFGTRLRASPNRIAQLVLLCSGLADAPGTAVTRES